VPLDFYQRVDCRPVGADPSRPSRVAHSPPPPPPPADAHASDAHAPPPPPHAQIERPPQGGLYPGFDGSGGYIPGRGYVAPASGGGGEGLGWWGWLLVALGIALVVGLARRYRRHFEAGRRQVAERYDSMEQERLTDRRMAPVGEPPLANGHHRCANYDACSGTELGGGRGRGGGGAAVMGTGGSMEPEQHSNRLLGHDARSDEML